MKRSLDPFRAVPLLELKERPESAACTETELYIGTAQGSLLHYALAWGGGGPEDVASAARRVGSVDLSPKRPVEQVHALPGLAVALVDGAIHVLPADITSFAGSVLCREAKLFCTHTGTEDRGQGHPREICVSFRKKLVLYAHKGRGFEQLQEFQAPEAACTLAWHQSWICVGYRREYALYSDKNGVPREVFRLDGKVTPSLCVAGIDLLLLLVQESRGLFLNLGSQQLAPEPLSWPRKVVRLGVVGGFVLGSTGQGQVDVFSLRDQRNCQTLALEGTTVAICGTAGGRVIVVGEASVTCLDLVPFDRQLQKLMMQLRVSDALDLLNATFGPQDPEREKQLSRFHVQAGWALFRDLQFLPAFQHFTFSADFRLASVLSLWRGYLPSKFDPQAFTDRGSGESDGPNFSGSIRDFIRERLSERQKSEGASDSAVSANVDIANAGMVSFLLKQRQVLIAEDRLPAAHRKPGSDPAPLLQAVDTALLKLLVEIDQDDLRLQQLLEGGVRCAVEDCEGLLRGKNRIDVLARLWKEQGMHEQVLREWSSLLIGIDEGSSSAVQAAAALHVTKAQIVSEMCSALKSASSHTGGADLLRQYVPKLLKVDESAVLPVFADSPVPGYPVRCPLSVDEVLRLLEGHDAVVLGYLEHMVSSKRDVEPQHRSKLGLMYISQVAAERAGARSPEAGLSSMRQRLLRFLEEAEGVDARELLPRVEALGLHEEQAALHCREQQHQEALRILVVVLNDLPRAETYCRMIMAQQQQHSQTGAASSGPGSAASAAPRVSVFGADPPSWARPVAFGPRRGGDEEDPAVAATFAQGPRPGTSAPEPGGARPLMALLSVLLDASSGAEQKPSDYRKVAAEYREAALSLLTAYAGHRDLPPTEVIGMLPADWTLESLAGYLTKCARICLHEQRVSMLEKKLSSMAYLKTFSALAHERSRKVTISRDRCCPVCNRRFVDKDSVGKAFVAYPNETCVHLQCKDDISICPKTGASFADNLSVYCNALGGVDVDGSES